MPKVMKTAIPGPNFILFWVGLAGQNNSKSGSNFAYFDIILNYMRVMKNKNNIKAANEFG